MGNKTAYIGGGAGFIGHHMARRLKSEGYWVRVVDIKEYEYGNPLEFCDEFIIEDLRDISRVEPTLRLNKQRVYSYSPLPFEELEQFDEVYTFACLMGGAGFVFTGENDADIMHDSALINLNMAHALVNQNFKGKMFYSSSACAYPQHLQNKNFNIGLKELDIFPAHPDSCYGWEKLFSEQLFLSYGRNKGLNIRIARFHNIYGPEGSYNNKKEKAPAAMCRKVIECVKFWEEESTKGEYVLNGTIDVWGTGEQTRSFLYIDDCIDAVRLLMQSDFKEPINIGSEESISINGLAQIAIDLSGKDIRIKNVESNAIGVNGRNSDNELIEKVLNWKPKYTLRQGMELTFNWIKSQYGV